MTGKQEEACTAAKAVHTVPQDSARDDQPKKLLDEDLAAVAGGFPMPFTGSASLPRPLD